MAVLDVRDLKTYYFTRRGPVKAVEDVAFQVEKGEALGLAGESGCGKTTVALSLLKILPLGGRIVGGEILFKGENVVPLSEDEMRSRIRWSGISLVFQGAMNALNPVYKVSEQIVESIQTHEGNVSKEQALERGKKLFEMVGMEEKRIDNYPHEFSGGMKQRAMIAMALACNPDILIADEPGTALDVIVQAQVLRLMKQLKEKLGLGMIMIAHDLSMIAEVCDKMAIMYAGYLAEYGDIEKLFHEPLHPYTQDLIESFPSIESEEHSLISIPGSPPDLLKPPPGCRFHPRCKYAEEICSRKQPPFVEIRPDHYVACHLIGGK